MHTSDDNVAMLNTRVTLSGHTLAALLGQLFDIVARAWVIREVQDSGESVQAVAHGDVNGLPKNAVPLVCVRNHLHSIQSIAGRSPFYGPYIFFPHVVSPGCP